ncbi:hypothetical protein PINS_up010408 [Pythium insidiosum]|nr:hypothetical protein PINS_up010408 [Pythium insidiosum]
MKDYPAKDVINSLTMLAEQVQFAPEIVSFLETKIHRAPPNYKLPIFYLTDSILKNVKGPYISLLGRNIVPLYCNCVKQVSGKDLRRFVHVLNTWDTTRLFPVEALAQMRKAANRALAVAEPSTLAQPASFSQEPAPPSRRPVAPAAAPQHDMELRALLTQMQNDMGIHPTEHLSLEQVRVQNPEWYNQLVEFHAASNAPMQSPPVAAGAHIPHELPINSRRVNPAPGRNEPIIGPPPARDPRRSRFQERAPVQPAPMPMHPPVQTQRPAPPRAPAAPRAQAPPEPVRSGNVAHLMELMARKKASPTPTPTPTPAHQQEITNEYPPSNTPNAAAVMSILQKLKGISGGGQPTQTPPATQPQPSQPMQSTNDSGASKMWFSDKIVAHKDRVESNVQKLYAALPLVCRESGLRFKENAKLNAHLDFLFQYNRAQKERGKGGVSRSWYPDEDLWVSDFSGDTAPRETTSSSFFDRKEVAEEQVESYEDSHVPVDESITRCRICGENFAKSWDEEEEDWVYTNAVYGAIHDPHSQKSEKTIFHKFCYETVMANSKHVTPEHLIPVTPQGDKSAAGVFKDDATDHSGIKRRLDNAEYDEDDSDDEDDIKRIKSE